MRKNSWGNIFRNALARGEDHGYAAHLADQWEKRNERKQKSMTPTLGQIAYDAYCEKRNWKSVRGEPLPHYRQQDGGIIEAWEAAADAVAKMIAVQTGRG